MYALTDDIFVPPTHSINQHRKTMFFPLTLRDQKPYCGDTKNT